MPNWCNNKLAIYGPVADVTRFREQAIGYSPWTHIKEQKENALSFHSLVPVPPEVLAAGYDAAGYDWEIAHWGCKWGACHSELADEWEGHLEYTFDTAWTPPIPFLTKLAREWPTLIFLLEYEEMGMGFKGISKFVGDDVEDHCLYIEKIHRPLLRQYGPLFEATIKLRDSLPPKSREFKAAQKEVIRYYDLMYSEGYFRDSDRAPSVLARLGLSWQADVIPLCTEDQQLCDESLRQFRLMVAKAKLALPSKAELEMQGGTVAEVGTDSLPEWHSYFAEKRTLLLSFLDQAIRLKSPVHCSL